MEAVDVKEPAKDNYQLNEINTGIRIYCECSNKVKTCKTLFLFYSDICVSGQRDRVTKASTEALSTTVG